MNAVVRNAIRPRPRPAPPWHPRVPRDPVRPAADRAAPLPGTGARRAVGRRPGRVPLGTGRRAERRPGAAGRPHRRFLRESGPRQRELPDAERLHAGPRRGAATGAVLDPRRRVHDRHRQRADLRRRPPRQARQLRRRIDPLPPRCVGLPDARPAGTRLAIRVEPGPARHARRARLGAGEHRGLRRRSAPA